MGDLSNLFYYKQFKESWADTKCQVDECYSMPFKNGDTRYLQSDFAGGYDIREIWITKEDGTRVYDIIDNDGEWSVVKSPSFAKVSFKLPTLGDGDCYQIQTGEEAGCIVNMVDWTGFPSPVPELAADYIAGDPTIQTYLVLNAPPFTQYNLDVNPPDFIQLTDDPLIYNVKCDAFPIDILYNFYFKKGTDPFYGGGFRQPEPGGTPFPVIEDVKCFHIEIPLLDGEGNEIYTLSSEPFACVDCVETLVIHSDYCLSKTDIDGNHYFDFAGSGATTMEGNLFNGITNHMRIQAVVKVMPAKVSSVINGRCHNFKSKKTKKFKIQGAFPIDFPPYMGNAIESAFSGKIKYINDREYLLDTETLFIERNVAGYSMWKLDAQLTDCERGLVFDCSCVVVPPNCEENPVTGTMVILPAPDVGGEFGVDRSYLLARIYPTGGVLPYIISNWRSYYAPENSDLLPFDDSSEVNIFRRDNFNPVDSGYSVLVDVTDARGCTYTLGLTVDQEDLRCVEDTGSFQVEGAGSGQIKIVNVFPTGLAYEYSFDNTNYFDTGVSSPTPYTITGLTPGGEVLVYVRVRCNCEGDDCQYGYIGPYRITVP